VKRPVPSQVGRHSQQDDDERNGGEMVGAPIEAQSGRQQADALFARRRHGAFRNALKQQTRIGNTGRYRRSVRAAPHHSRCVTQVQARFW